MYKKLIVIGLLFALALPAMAFWPLSSKQKLKVTADTWIYQFKPDKNYGNGWGWADITDPTKSVTVPKMFLGFGGADKKIILLKFDQSALKKNKGIKKAEAAIYNDFAGSAMAIKVDARKVISPWEEMSVTYNKKPQTAEKILSSTVLQGAIDFAQKGKWYKFDVTAAVQSWQKGDTNYGIMLDPEGDAGVDFDIVAREYTDKASYAPVLEVQYQ